METISQIELPTIAVCTTKMNVSTLKSVCLCFTTPFQSRHATTTYVSHFPFRCQRIKLYCRSSGGGGDFENIAIRQVPSNRAKSGHQCAQVSASLRSSKILCILWKSLRVLLLSKCILCFVDEQRKIEI